MIPLEFSLNWQPECDEIAARQHLTLREKLYFGQELASGRVKAKTLKTKYKINRKTLMGYKNKIKNKSRVQEKNGRPPALDESFQLLIIEILQTTPLLTEVEFRGIIRQKHHECWLQWHQCNENAVYKRISIRSVRRYSKSLRLRAFPQQQEQQLDIFSTCTCS